MLFLNPYYPALVNRRRAFPQQENSPGHTVYLTMRKLEKLEGLEVMPHPANSPYLATTDYHIFQAMAYLLRGSLFLPLSHRNGISVELLAQRW